MIKVALLGDSIRLMGYGPLVPALLGDGFEVFQPEENCRYAKFTLRGLVEWQAGLESCDIVHWNVGLWDTGTGPDGAPFSTPEEYLLNVKRIAAYLTARHRAVIFASTTPVKPGHPSNDTSRIAAYNALVVPELKKTGVLINDLFTLVSADIDRCLRDDDKIHLTAAGASLCAARIADVIRSAARG